MVETHTISIVELHIALKRIIKDVQVQEVGNLLQGGILKPDAEGRRFSNSRLAEIASLIKTQRSAPTIPRRPHTPRPGATATRAEAANVVSYQPSASSSLVDRVTRATEKATLAALDAHPVYQRLKAIKAATNKATAELKSDRAVKNGMGGDLAEVARLEAVGEFEAATGRQPTGSTPKRLGPTKPEVADYAARWAATRPKDRAQYGNSFRAFESYQKAVKSGRVRFTSRDGSRDY